ncbi:MAG: extracellular solute-binding protein [Bacillota bacterium]|nr:extracellular solute-binding protein [Bacillota bacterium]
MVKSKQFARLLCLVLIVSLISLTAACTQTETTEPAGTTKAPDGTTTTGTTQPTEKEPVTLTIFLDAPDRYNGEWEWGDDPVSAHITELTGISLDYDYATTDGGEQLSTMLASGQGLPDLIHTGSESRANMIISQGFAMSLNKLADEYNPEFYQVCPEDFILIFQDENGDIYAPPQGFFGNVTPEDDIKAPMTVAGINVNMPIYEKLGEPAMDTWDQVYDVLLAAKDEGLTFPLYMDEKYIKGVANSPTNAVQMITKCFGGPSTIWPQSDDSVLVNVRADEYREAIKYLNRCYRADLLNPENFTISTDEVYFDIAEGGMIFMHLGHGWNIYRATKVGQTADAIYWPVEFPAGPGVNSDDIKFKDYDASTVSSYAGMFVTKDTEYPDRCIDYITFLLSDEGQMLQREGLEGISYNMVDGLMVYTEERVRLEQEDPNAPALVQGLRHPAIALSVMSRVNAMFRYIRGESQPTYGLWCEIQRGHTANERIYSLTESLRDEDDIVLRTKVLDVWAEAQPLMILAESEEECVAAYDKCIKDMEQAGLKNLETIYSERYKMWKDRGITLPEGKYYP